MVLQLLATTAAYERLLASYIVWLKTMREYIHGKRHDDLDNINYNLRILLWFQTGHDYLKLSHE